MNKENLLKLADYLDGEVTQEQFNMAWYRTANDGRITDFYNTHDCGSVGCALGWSPFVKGLEPHDCDYVDLGDDYGEYLNFRDYSARVFDLSSSEWTWCFDSYWVKIDNTPSGAAKRIRYLVEHGIPLEWFAPLPYDPEIYDRKDGES